MRFDAFFLSGACLLWMPVLHAEEIQLSCTFKSESKASSFDPESPEFKTKKDDGEYLIFFEPSKNEASYINLRYKDKRSLEVAWSSRYLTTFVEPQGFDNHFTISVFWSEVKGREIPVVKFGHMWQPRYDFYAPSVTLGTCRQL